VQCTIFVVSIVRRIIAYESGCGIVDASVTSCLL
jgi:hypothetical protein